MEDNNKSDRLDNTLNELKDFHINSAGSEDKSTEELITDLFKNQPNSTAKKGDKGVRNTKIVGAISLVCVLAGILLPDRNIGGWLVLLGFAAGIFWLARKNHIFFTR